MRKRKILMAGFLILVGALLFIWFSGGDSDFDEISYAEKQIGVELESRKVDVGVIKLHVIFAGPEDGEPVILIHGFPEFWFGWRHQIAALAKMGYRVAAPDMRGYNRSDKPQGNAAYSFKNYARDITGLIDSQGWEQANVVGHDIGARVAWQLVFGSPDRIKKAVILSVGHPLAFAEATTESDVSWYRTFFAMPVLPELLSRAGGLSLTANSMRKSSRPGTFSDEDLAVYKAAWDRDHAFSTMLGAYRNLDEKIANLPSDGKPQMPVLFLFGEKDKYLTKDVAVRTKKYLGAANVKLFPKLSHWMVAEEPAIMAAEIDGFLRPPENAIENK